MRAEDERLDGDDLTVGRCPGRLLDRGRLAGRPGVRPLGPGSLRIEDGDHRGARVGRQRGAATPPGRWRRRRRTGLHRPARAPARAGRRGGRDVRARASRRPRTAASRTICATPDTRPAWIGRRSSSGWAPRRPRPDHRSGHAPWAALTVGREGTTLGPLASLAAAGRRRLHGPARGDHRPGAAARGAHGGGRPGPARRGPPGRAGADRRCGGERGPARDDPGACAARRPPRRWPPWRARSPCCARSRAEMPPDVRPHLHLTRRLGGRPRSSRSAAPARRGCASPATSSRTTSRSTTAGWAATHARRGMPRTTRGRASPRRAAPYDVNVRVDPPLRSPEDAIALLAALEDGTIDAIATQHLPVRAVDKELPVRRGDARHRGPRDHAGPRAGGGRRPAAWAWRARCGRCPSGPYRVLDGARHGLAEPSLREGATADLVVFDRGDRWTVERAALRSRAANTPFAGRRLPGRVLLTVSRGRVAWLDLGEPDPA